MSRREERRSQTIVEIKQIARRQMAEMGATNISLRAIAREMGLSTPALYRYFPNFEALITTLVLDAYEQMAEQIESAEASTPRNDFGKRFLIAAHAMRNWAVMNPSEYMLIQGTPIPGYQAPDEVTRPAAQRSWRVVLVILLEAQAAGQLNLPIEFAHEWPNYAAYCDLWSEQMGVTLTVPLLHAVMSAAASFNGLLIAEVSNRFPGVSAETTLIEIDSIRQRLGLPEPFDPERTS